MDVTPNARIRIQMTIKVDFRVYNYFKVEGNIDTNNDANKFGRWLKDAKIGNHHVNHRMEFQTVLKDMVLTQNYFRIGISPAENVNGTIRDNLGITDVNNDYHTHLGSYLDYDLINLFLIDYINAVTNHLNVVGHDNALDGVYKQFHH